MNKVEKMKIESYANNIEDYFDNIVNDIYSVEYFVKKIKTYIKESEVEQEPEVDILGEIREEIINLDDAHYNHEGYYQAISDAVSVIDKYRGEG